MRHAILASTILVAVVASRPSRADQITYTYSVSNAPVAATCTYSQVALPQWNGDPSALTGVTIAASAQLTGYGSDVATSANGVVDVAYSIALAVNGPGLAQLSCLQGEWTLVANMPLQLGYTTQNWSQTLDIGPVLQEPTSFSAYVGNGDVYFPITMSEDSDVCYIVGGTIDCNRTFAWELSVTYSYVPEPMSLALLSSGLLGTGLTLRRKRPLRRSLLLLAGRQFRRPLRPANGRDQR